MANKLSSKQIEMLLAKMQKPKQSLNTVENTGKNKPRPEENPVSKEAMAMFMGQLQRKADSQKKYINDAGPAPVYKNVGEKVRADLERESRQRDLRASIPNEKFNTWVENVGLPAAEIGMYADLAAPIVKNLSKKSVELLSELPLNNVPYLNKAYRFNPWAFETQQGKIYRQVGEPGLEAALKEKKIYDKGQKEFLEDFPDYNYLDGYNEAINAKGFYITKPPPAPFFSKDKLFFPIDRKATGKGFKKTANSDAEYLIEGSVPDEGLLPRYMDRYLKPGESSSNTFVLRPEYSDLQNFNLYERNWLQGYKPKKISEETLNILKKKKNG